MPQLLPAFVWFPLLAFLASMLIPEKKEKLISALAISTTAIHLAGGLIFTTYWLLNGYAVLDYKYFVLYQTTGFEFFIDFYFDKITAVYSVIGAGITLLVSIFSRFYLHRDEGFKRFFNTLLLFFLGYNTIIFSGNFETLFIGWELLGFCSFLLIAFYRDRYLPVKNGLKVISIYRLGDVCLMLAMWMCHHLFHANITFERLNDAEFTLYHFTQSPALYTFTAMMILIAAAAKSAMLPFSSWLPRAMEGPTTSSAVFYGSLSVHLGAFLLMRTYPLWEGVVAIKVLIITLGIATSLIATAIARVQSSVKTQIAYSSITQIGLIFIEVALGLHTLALIHFAGNTFLRTYQLLVSPSVLSYQIHDMFFNFKPETPKHNRPFQKLRNAVYMLSIKEWNLDHFMYNTLWNPFKWLGRNMNFLVRKISITVLSAFFLIGIFGFIAKDSIPDHFEDLLSLAFSIPGLMLILKAFAERNDARRAWLFVIAGQLFITLSIAHNNMPWHQILIYLSGVVVSAIGGYYCLNIAKTIDNDIRLNRFHGYSYDKPSVSFVFLVCCLGLLAFPFTPTFLGIDLLFTNIHSSQPLLMVSTAVSFIFMELAVLRIYARIFLGPHKKNDHPIAFRSS